MFNQAQRAALHEALEQTILAAMKIHDGRVGRIGLALRYDKDGGEHVHASAQVTHRIYSTVQVTNK